MVMALVFIGRLDQPAVQRNWETKDAGYATYLGYLGFEESNTHPVLLVSIQCFLSGPAGKRYRNRIMQEQNLKKFTKKKISHENSKPKQYDDFELKNSTQASSSNLSSADTLNDERDVFKINEKPMESASFRARWRWQFAYMMVKNPSLVVERNKTLYKQKIKEKMLEQRGISEKIGIELSESEDENRLGGMIRTEELNV